MKIAQVAPLVEAVPPKLYGGTERVVAYLTDALVELGHEVTLFASGDSLTKATLVPIWPRALRLDPSVKDPFRTGLHADGNGGAPRARVRRDPCASRLLRLSVVAPFGRALGDDTAWPPGLARTAAALRTVRRHAGRFHIRLAARPIAAGQLRGHRIAWSAEGSAGEGVGSRRLSRLPRPHFPGEGAGCGDPHRRRRPGSRSRSPPRWTGSTRSISRRTIEPLLSLGRRRVHRRDRRGSKRRVSRQRRRLAVSRSPGGNPSAW